MIFGKNYDRSLCVLTSSNKKTRIIDFVKSIPSDFLKEIQESLDTYNLYLYKNKDIPLQDREKINLSGRVTTTGDMLYWYSIDSVTGALNIGECIDDNEECYDVFQITLYPLKREYYNRMECLDIYLLGDISYNYAQEYVDDELCTIDSDETEFNLIRLPFGKFVVCSLEIERVTRDNGEIVPKVRNRYNYINVRNIPYDYDMSRLNDSKNKLVRSRKRNSK